jgi:hypothetical protein
MSANCWGVLVLVVGCSDREEAKSMKRRAWTAKDVRTLKKLAGKRTRAKVIARTLRRTEGATRQKAFSLGVSLETRAFSMN